MTRQIIAMGGGGFLMEADNPWLDDYVLTRARRQPARICFVPTASGDASSNIVKFYRAFSRRDCKPTDLVLFGSQGLPRQPALSSDLTGFIAEQDIVYVGGGNTANMLAVWWAHGLHKILRTAWENGTVMCGISAGMLCWFTAGVTDAFGSLAPFRDGLGLLPGSACPHYDGEVDRRPRYHALIRDGFPGGYAADDGAAICFEGDKVSEVVSSRRSAGAYHVTLKSGHVVEHVLDTRYLGE
ncbi:MAG: Type 1 glutamine amidotransferase-like domain-containing protein [Kofleriaceae bacterium]